MEVKEEEGLSFIFIFNISYVFPVTTCCPSPGYPVCQVAFLAGTSLPYYLLGSVGFVFFRWGLHLRVYCLSSACQRSLCISVFKTYFKTYFKTLFPFHFLHLFHVYALVLLLCFPLGLYPLVLPGFCFDFCDVSFSPLHVCSANVLQMYKISFILSRFLKPSSLGQEMSLLYFFLH